MVKYKYDAFGNCECYYTTNNDLSNGNPIRYRSYYYDTDTGLYYLNARYYNPQWRRFISPARTSTINIDTVNGLNLYAYAENNPICINYKNNCVNRINSISIDKASFNSKISFMVASSALEAFSPKAFSIHTKSELLSTDWPSFFAFTSSKAALVDWEISIYKVSLNFDAAEIHSFYASLGNISAFAGYNIEEGKFGVFADANVLSAGYDGRYIDAGVSVVGVGFILGWEDKKFRFKFDPPGWFGVDISIDFGQIIKDILRWKW